MEYIKKIRIMIMFFVYTGMLCRALVTGNEPIYLGYLFTIYMGIHYFKNWPQMRTEKILRHQNITLLFVT